MSTRLAIIQARVGSSRLAGKVLAPILGKPLLGLMVERVQRVKNLDGIVIATTELSGDDAIADLALELGCGLFRGSSEDVLDRYYRAAQAQGADPVIRLTADCPLVDPEVTSSVIAAFDAGDFDYLSLVGEFPDGFDTEVMTLAALERAWREASRPSEREHVTPYIWNNPGRFRIGRWNFPVAAGHLRLTVDEARDLELVRAVYERLYAPDIAFGWREIMALLEREPALLDINAGIPRNAGYTRSLAEDGREAGL